MEEQPLPYNPNPITPPSLATPAFKMALMIAGMMIAYTLVLYVVNQSTNRVLGYVNYLLIISGLLLATFNFRDKEMGGFITFGKAFHFGFMISLFVSLIYGVFCYIYFKFIAHDIITQIIRMAEDAMVKQNMPEDQMQKALEISKKYVYIPGSLAIGAFFVTLFFSSILSLISSGIAKRDPPINFPPAV